MLSAISLAAVTSPTLTQSLSSGRSGSPAGSGGKSSRYLAFAHIRLSFRQSPGDRARPMHSLVCCAHLPPPPALSPHQVLVFRYT